MDESTGKLLLCKSEDLSPMQHESEHFRTHCKERGSSMYR